MSKDDLKITFSDQVGAGVAKGDIMRTGPVHPRTKFGMLIAFVVGIVHWDKLPRSYIKFVKYYPMTFEVLNVDSETTLSVRQIC